MTHNSPGYNEHRPAGDDDQGDLPPIVEANNNVSEEAAEPLEEVAQLVSDALLNLVYVSERKQNI